MCFLVQESPKDDYSLEAEEEFFYEEGEEEAEDDPDPEVELEEEEEQAGVLRQWFSVITVVAAMVSA